MFVVVAIEAWDSWLRRMGSTPSEKNTVCEPSYDESHHTRVVVVICSSETIYPRTHCRSGETGGVTRAMLSDEQGWSGAGDEARLVLGGGTI